MSQDTIEEARVSARTCHTTARCRYVDAGRAPRVGYRVGTSVCTCLPTTRRRMAAKHTAGRCPLAPGCPITRDGYVNPGHDPGRPYIRGLFRRVCMLEFLFGMVMGVWMGQQFPLPNVQTQIHNWWFRKPPVPTVADDDKDTKEEETAPLFTGEMPSV